MERIHRLQRHPLFQEQLSLLQEAEQSRVFCGHSMEHLLAVARLMRIYSLEQGDGLDKALIYAAALLHDIGRYEQLTRGTPHQEAGARMAGLILPDCGFSPAETARVQAAIASHRTAAEQTADPLSAHLYRADKRSRCCFCCPAADACNWPDQKKNHVILD